MHLRCLRRDRRDGGGRAGADPAVGRRRWLPGEVSRRPPRVAVHRDPVAGRRPAGEQLRPRSGDARGGARAHGRPAARARRRLVARLAAPLDPGLNPPVPSRPGHCSFSFSPRATDARPCFARTSRGPGESCIRHRIVPMELV
ncbi:Exonuclease SbcC [Microbacterium sp. Nx66]|nr:Exonuclease SbcC [Microbacterium sp. Nx66]